MKTSLIFFCFFLSGIFLGQSHILPELEFIDGLPLYLLYLLMLLVGISIGMDTQVLCKVINIKIHTLLVPLGNVVGSLIGVGLLSIFIPEISLMDSFAVGAGFGYYSLSSIMVTQLSGETLGVISLLVNIIREISTILLAPLLVRFFGKLAPIATGGATSMDTTLPIIVKNAGNKYAVVAVINGLILSILVPLLIPIFLL